VAGLPVAGSVLAELAAASLQHRRADQQPVATAALLEALEAAMPQVVRGWQVMAPDIAVEVDLELKLIHHGWHEFWQGAEGTRPEPSKAAWRTDEDASPLADPNSAHPGRSSAEAQEFWAAPGVDQPASTAGSTSITHSPEVLSLRSAVDALAAQEPTQLPGDVALQRSKDLLVECERLKALALEALSDVDRRELYTSEGSPTTNAWITGLHVPGVGKTEITLARRLRAVPRVAEELKAGRLSGQNAGRITTALTKARSHLDQPDGRIDGQVGEEALYGVCVNGISTLLAEQGRPLPAAVLSTDVSDNGTAGEAGQGADDSPSPAERAHHVLREELEALLDAPATQVARLEASLLVLARHSDPVQLPAALAQLLDALLPGEHEKRAQKAEDERGLTLTRHSDRSGGSVRGDLDDEAFEFLSVLVQAGMATDPDSPDDTRAWRDRRAAGIDADLDPDDWPAGQPRPRSAKQRRHDAFRSVLRKALDHGLLGTRGKALPHVVITVGADLLDGVPGSLPGRSATGGRWSQRQVRRLLCQSRFTRMVLDVRSRVVDVSHTSRTATALERLLGHVESGGVCQRRSCSRGPATGHRLVPHHGDPWARTGTTSLRETIWFCEADHDHELHRKGRALELKDGRIVGPDGWIRREPLRR
jgi:hypothetical protein